jgi:2-polyprenyl-6-hydroxyphenyl methylase/3-demethylubiquinone-9 3-methyltransferase
MKIREALGPGPHRVLDVACGAGFLSNALARVGHEVTALDAAPSTLEIARAHDTSKRVRYELGDAHHLPYSDGSFDAVCAMDFLEHTAEPERIVAEAARVLRASGVFLFHTFNRNVLSWLVVIKGVEWFVANTPRHLHVLGLFLTPAEVRSMCVTHGMSPLETIGSRPKVDRAFFRMLWTRSVPKDFAFVHTSSTLVGFSGVAQKRSAEP